MDWHVRMFRTRASRLARLIWTAAGGSVRAVARSDNLESPIVASVEAPQSSEMTARAFVSHTARVFGLGRAQSVHPTAAFHIHEDMPVGNPLGRISIGKGSYIGKEVEFATCNFIIVGDDTSIQDYCRISGDTEIGAHCVFAPYIFIGSGHHRFRDRPEWLIRDQDKAVFNDPGIAVEPITRPVIIEDDCWLGWNVVVCPGVYVGRGAIIGANSVVTSDIGPYEIHGGSPNRKIGERLRFLPPHSLDAMNDRDLPYLYRGFDLRQARLQVTRAVGFVEAGSRSSVVLEAAVGKQVSLRGIWLGKSGVIKLRLNGADCEAHVVDSGPFEIRAAVPERGNGISVEGSTSSAPKSLSAYTYVEIEDVTPDQVSHPDADCAARYGLSTVSVVP